MDTLTLPAPAKLNLFLHITDQREDGYHELQTIFQFLDYSDEIIFSQRKDGKIRVNSKIPYLSANDNLVMRAAKLLRQHDKKRQGVDITLHKKIPIGGGLGGGSSDAATTLCGLNTLWGLNLNQEYLLNLALQLGADVPVFVRGQACWAEGVGDALTPLTDLPEPWFLVVVPPVQVSTAEIFFDKQLTRNTAKSTISTQLIETGKNDCETTVSRHYPEVNEALQWLNSFSPARMTGTGACVFARFDKEEDALNVLKKIEAPFTGFIAKGLNHSPLHTTLEYWDVAKRYGTGF
jgi:4-diphosphocytidyl-2-C-methyl-D-erythritol kinase